MVTLSFGSAEYEVASPHLRGCEAILGELKPEDYRRVMDAFAHVSAGDAEQGDTAGTVDSIIADLFPLLSRVPRIAEDVLWACLRTKEGKSIPRDVVQEATLEDVGVVVGALLDGGHLARLKDLAKNALSRATAKTAEVPEAPAEQPASGSAQV